MVKRLGAQISDFLWFRHHLDAHTYCANVAVEAATPAPDSPRSPRYGSGGSLDSVPENPRAERKATGYEIQQAREKYEGMKEHQLRRLCAVGCHRHQLCLL